MNYQFPIIRTIDDVLPHIEGREEFIVAERDFGTVINYVVAMDDTFPPVKVAGGSAKMRAERALTNAMRRECRGLIFDLEGKIMSRPFHKFFNINEREETQMKNIDITEPHVIMEKMDGSMIRPILVDGHLRLATKMGVTDVAMQAESWLAAHSHSEHLKQWLRWCIDTDVTPIFEWVSPFNQIVLAYEEPDLVLLAMRDNETGEYHMPDACPFSVVPQYGRITGNITDYIARQREAEGREGDIIRFSDGHMLKVKNDWYVRIHKTVDLIRFDRHIVDLILNEQLDDVVPMLPEKEAEKVRKFEHRFWTAFEQTEEYLGILFSVAMSRYEGDKKRVALEMVPNIETKTDAQFIFKMMDGKPVREALIEHIKKSISTNTKWDETAKWLGV